MKSGGHEMAPRPPPLRIDRAFSSIALAATVFTLGLWPAFAWGQAGDANAGKAVYERKCLLCHGEKGDGKGPAAELLDPKPRDFTSGIYKIRTTAGQAPQRPDLHRGISGRKRWTFRGGGSRTEIATRLAIGVLGTPMPTFIDSVEKPEDIWHLTNYVLSLGPESPGYATLITVTAVSDAIPDDPDADFWKKMAPQNVGLMGQVIQDPRNFNPSIDMVAVRAARNDKGIAVHLTWDHPSESQPDPATKG